jgi:hypothetical protein
MMATAPLPAVLKGAHHPVDSNSFDSWTRRRVGLAAGGVMSAVLGALARGDTAAKKRRKRKKPPLVFNQFGCVDAGNPCRGNDALCCSGICEGKKPKKGRKDRRRCAAHDTGGCPVGHAPCTTPHTACTTSAGLTGFCATTTGNAAYCTTGTGGECFPCTRDADCRQVCGMAAACITCLGCAGGATCATTVACDFSP